MGVSLGGCAALKASGCTILAVVDVVEGGLGEKEMSVSNVVEVGVDVLLSVENSRRANSAVAPRFTSAGGQAVKAPAFRISLPPSHFPQDIPIAAVMAEDAVAVQTTVAEHSTLRCVASTGDKYRCTVDEAHPGWADLVHGYATRADKDESNCFRHALLSADGTAVVTYNEDLILRTFAV